MRVIQDEPEVNPCDELISDGVGVEALIYLRRRVMHDKTAVLLSCLSRGVVLGWPMDPHHGRCLGKFLAVSAPTESFGAAAVTDDNEFFITADSNGYVKACFIIIIRRRRRRIRIRIIAVICIDILALL